MTDVYLAAAPYLASSLGLVATLLLFASLKAELRRATRRERQRAEEVASRLGNMEREPVFIPVAPRPGFNIERRVHALRLFRRGEDAAHIAATLGIPRCEAELLIRVQQMAGGRLVESAVSRPR